MDIEACEIFCEQPDLPRTPGLWRYGPSVVRVGLNCTITTSFRDGRPFLNIWPSNGGWLGCFLDDLLGDVAPDAG